jgi:hypothetical protein
LPNLLSQWQFHYNWFRAHSSLKGKSPIQGVNELAHKTPVWDEVGSMYDPLKERIKVQIIGLILSYISETMSVNLTVLI